MFRLLAIVLNFSSSVCLAKSEGVVVTWYITVSPMDTLGGERESAKLVAFLRARPELIQTDAATFQGAPGQPWLQIALVKTNGNGWIVHTGVVPALIDEVDMCCSYFEDEEWYESIAADIARFLGWHAHENAEGRQVWPPLPPASPLQ